MLYRLIMLLLLPQVMVLLLLLEKACLSFFRIFEALEGDISRDYAIYLTSFALHFALQTCNTSAPYLGIWGAKY